MPPSPPTYSRPRVTLPVLPVFGPGDRRPVCLEARERGRGAGPAGAGNAHPDHMHRHAGAPRPHFLPEGAPKPALGQETWCALEEETPLPPSPKKIKPQFKKEQKIETGSQRD